MKRFLPIGECMVELAQAGDNLYRRGFAGDTFNTAWYARRLLPQGWTVGYLSAIGTDSVSQEMASFISAEGIDPRYLRPVPDRTVGLYMISVEDGERSFSYWRDASAARKLADDAQWLRAAILDQPQDSVLYFSGITLAILPPEQRTLLCDLLQEARSQGATVAFDTNLRPRLWESQAQMQAGMRLGAASADIVLPSFDEEVTLFGDTTPEDTVDRYRGCGAKVVAVKNSGGDLMLWDAQDGARTVPAERVAQPVDTTAAGDSFGAGFVSGLALGKRPDEAAAGAMSLAAQVIQEHGALARGIFEATTSNGAKV